MPSYVLKAAPDDDCYAIFSTVVMGETFAGTRDETAAELDRRGWSATELLERADRTGTSCPEQSFGAWNGPDPVVLTYTLPGLS
ncbi:hypothetical protein [Planomonospora sp. ID82291]|uniref:hypothetical protein n=1 Tax=Planomonospora sp. ID82291 TaxID=2738136 RepID=UPI0018C3DFB1|nr:hypothetical protein [Planomonospora sp. ID82291]MBG0818303.1 hypothetical protein [Planomonospora sp. ID82291]